MYLKGFSLLSVGKESLVTNCFAFKKTKGQFKSKKPNQHNLLFYCYLYYIQKELNNDKSINYSNKFLTILLSRLTPFSLVNVAKEFCLLTGIQSYASQLLIFTTEMLSIIYLMK